jgi:polyhydroxyalkanoate synthesis regulator phasin
MKRLLIALAAVAVIGLGAVAVGGAVGSAQEGDGPVGTFISKLAGKLGVSEDELTTAIKDTRIEMIDEAVADGRLTQEQADRLKEKINESDYGLFGFGRGFGVGPGLCHRAAGHVLDTAAEVLDMPKDELAQQLKDGKSLAAVADAEGMSVEDFKAALLDKEKANLDAAVEDGKLTQDQADNIYGKLQDNIDTIVNAVPGEDGPCHDGPRHRFGGADRPFDEEPDA